MKGHNQFIWTVKNAYDDIGGRRNVVGAAFLVGFSMLAYWVFYAFEPLLTLVNKAFAGALLRGAGLAGGPLLEAAGQAVLPLLLLLGLFLVLYVRYRGRPDPKTRADRVLPDPHEGLVFLLSPYRLRMSPEDARERGIPVDAEALTALLKSDDADAFQDVRRKMFGTTWGPLWAVAEHHRSTLEHVWLLSTKGPGGSHPDVEAAVLLVKAAAVMRNVTCHIDEGVIEDANDLEEIVRLIDEEIYEKSAVAEYELEEDQVIADFTGGTAAMSAGMAMATMDPERKVEYVRQHPELLTDDGRARTTEEIREEPILVMLETWHELAPRRTDERHPAPKTRRRSRPQL